MPLANPVGWQDVPLADCGGGPDGHSLSCWIVQVHIKENHQNGKDTHIRGIKIYALDENAASGPMEEAIHEMEANNYYVPPPGAAVETDVDQEELQNLRDMLERAEIDQTRRPNDTGLSIYEDWMRDPEIR